MAIVSGEDIRLSSLLSLFFQSGCPEDTAAAQRAIRDFIACGDAIRTTPKDDKTGQPLPYSFIADAESIVAAFQQVYRIDLTSAKMHWWRFCALLKGLITHSFQERVKYRTANPADIKDTKMRANWQRLKRLYSLDRRGELIKEPQTLEELNEMLLRQARGEG